MSGFAYSFGLPFGADETPGKPLLDGINQHPGNISFLVDPDSLDLMDTDDGWFVETADSRTIVMWQLEATFNAWWGDPASGSRIKAIMRGDDPATAQDLRNEILRALQPLVEDQFIAELGVALEGYDEGAPHRPVILINYRDLAANMLVGLSATPLGG